MVCIIEAVPYMLFPRGMKRMVRIVEQTPERYLQVIGLVAVILGIGFFVTLYILVATVIS